MTDKEHEVELDANGDPILKVTFAPGAFDCFEGTQEELDNLVKEIQESAENGTYSTRVLTDEDIDNLPLDVLKEMEAVLDEIEGADKDLDKLQSDYKKKLN